MPQFFFTIANLVALAGWVALAAGILFRKPFLRDWLAGTYVPLMLSAAYTLVILLFWWGAEGGYGSLADVQKLFLSPWVALGGWVHYLAFDLFVGAWLARRMMDAGRSRLLLLPILPLSFLFGPIGFLAGRALLLQKDEK